MALKVLHRVVQRLVDFKQVLGFVHQIQRDLTKRVGLRFRRRLVAQGSEELCKDRFTFVGLVRPVNFRKTSTGGVLKFIDIQGRLHRIPFLRMRE